MSNATLDRLLTPQISLPEYSECARCGGDLNQRRLARGNDVCQDCVSTAKNYMTGKQKRLGAKRHSDASFEVTVHYTENRHDPGRRGQVARELINGAGFTYLLCRVEDDPVAHHYVSKVLGHRGWPVVTVTSYGRLLAHWEGSEPGSYALLPGLWDQVQAGTAKPLIF